MAVLLLGVAIPVSLGAYAAAHNPAGQPLFTLGFSGMLQMKAWLATTALLFVGLQLVSALWMWARLPGAGEAPAWVPLAHRWSGTIAFLLSLPVAVHCLWALGLGDGTGRALAHGIVGCAFYGAYAAKMLGLRLPGLPAWAVPLLGGTVVSLFVLVWLTSALWFFTRSGISLL
jgi:hypothetical protein